MSLRAPALLAATLTLSVASVGCGDGYLDDNLVNDYCTYGAQSQAQLDSCRDHVTAAESAGATRPLPDGRATAATAAPARARSAVSAWRTNGRSYEEDLEDCGSPVYNGGRGGC